MSLELVDVRTISKEAIIGLWEKVKDAEYAFDDFSKGRGDLFLQALLTGEHYVCEEGYVALNPIAPRVNADIHFITFGKVNVRTIRALATEIIGGAFERYELSRMSAYIPTFNLPSIKLAQMLGFKQEGIIRQSFLHGGVYKDVWLGGLLRWEWENLAKSVPLQGVQSGRTE